MTKRIISHIILLVTLISSCQTYDALILQEDKTPSTVVSSNDISFDGTINTPISNTLFAFDEMNVIVLDSFQ